jgi:hypothetical protein
MTIQDLAPIIVSLVVAIWLCEQQRNDTPVIRRRDVTLDLTRYHIKKNVQRRRK